MAKLAVRRKYGVIVHSDFAKRQLEPIAAVPVRKINFPKPRMSKWFPRRPVARRITPDGKIQVLTFGMVNRNKMVDLVIETIGDSEYLRNHVLYTVIGAIDAGEYGKTVAEVIRKHDLWSGVRLLGPQPDE